MSKILLQRKLKAHATNLHENSQCALAYISNRGFNNFINGKTILSDEKLVAGSSLSSYYFDFLTVRMPQRATTIFHSFYLQIVPFRRFYVVVFVLFFVGL